MKITAFDTETYLITSRDKAPKPVCCTWCVDGAAPFITRPDDAWTLALWSDLDRVFVGVNIAFDIIVMMRWCPWLTPHMVRALDEGRVLDCPLRHGLIYLATKGALGYKPQISLADLAAQLLGRDLSATKKGDDVWRLKYGTLDGVPFHEWPAAALQYALDDARNTYDIFMQLGDPQQRYPTEDAQNQAAVALYATGTWGFGVDQTVRGKLKDAIGLQIQALDEKTKHLKWTGEGSQARLSSVIKTAWHQKHLKLLTQYAAATGVQVDAQQWAARVDPSAEVRTLLEQWAMGGTQTLPIFFPPGADAVSWLMEAHMRLPKIPVTEKGKISSAEEYLILIADEMPDAKNYVELKHKQKMMSTYIDPYTEETVHPRFVPMVATGRTGCREPNCFSLDTDLLTDEGWLSFSVLCSRYRCGEKMPLVAQWQPYQDGSGSILFVTAEGWIFMDGHHDMVRIHNGHIDLLVTPDHRCLLRRPTGRSRKKEVRLYDIQASAYKEDYQQIHAGIYHGPGSDLSNACIQLMVAVQADGSWHDNGIDFKFFKMRKIIRLSAILDALSATYTKRVDNRGRTCFRIKKSDLVDTIMGLLCYPTKHFKMSLILSFNRSQLDIFTEEVFYWDGLSTRRNNYSSSVKHNADIVQAAFILSGKRTNLRVYKESATQKRNDNYQLDITQRDFSWTTNTKVETQITHQVGCLSVPSSYVVVRRNGKVMVTGQCQNIPRKDKNHPEEAFRTMFRARPGKQLGTVDYSQLELCTLAATIRAQYPDVRCMLGEAIDNNTDVHCVTGSQISGVSYEQMMKNKKIEGSAEAKARQASKACFSADTELLTPTGWRRIDMLATFEGTTEIMQYCPHTKRLSFKKPLGWVVKEATEMIHLTGSFMDQMVTPEHRLLFVQKTSGHINEVLARKAGDIEETSLSVHGGLFNNTDMKKFSELTTRLAVMVQADGSFKSATKVYLGFTKPRKIQRCRALLEEANLEYEFKLVGELQVPTFVVPNRKEWCALDADKSFLAWYLYDADAFEDELWRWDGAVVKKHTRQYFNTKRKDVDCAQTILSCARKKTAVATEPPSDPAYSVMHRLNWYAGERKRNPEYCRSSGFKAEVVNKPQTTYCPSVPTSWVLTRRNGKVVVSGNCNFGLPGGLGAPALVSYAKNNYGVQIEETDARRFIAAWKQTWPEMNVYLAGGSKAVGRAPGGKATAVTVNGFTKANCSYSEYLNFHFQSLAAEGAKRAMWAYWRECTLGAYWKQYPGNGYGSDLMHGPLADSRMGNFVHDEIVGEHPLGDAGKAALKRQEQLMVDVMTKTCQNKITIRVEGALSDRWEH